MATWKINNLYRDVDNGCVQKADYSCSNMQNNISVIRTGTFVFMPISPTDPKFIPYESLTEQDVMNWIHKGLGQSGIDSMEAALLDDIENITNQKNSNGFPWENATTVEE